MRLGIEYTALDRREMSRGGSLSKDMIPSAKRFRLAGEALAIAWLQLAGCGVAPVLGQQPYDILAVLPSGRSVKIQVKTSCVDSPSFQLRTKSYDGDSQWFTIPYNADDVDFFFLLSSMDRMWLVPHERLVGQVTCRPGPEFEPYRITWP